MVIERYRERNDREKEGQIQSVNREKTSVAKSIIESRWRIFKWSLFMFEIFSNNNLVKRKPSTAQSHAHTPTHTQSPVHPTDCCSAWLADADAEVAGSSPTLLCFCHLPCSPGSVGPGKAAGREGTQANGMCLLLPPDPCLDLLGS